MTRSESLSISLTRRDDAVGEDAGFTVVWLQGDHDLSTRASVAAVIARASELDNANVLVDLSDVSFMDASTVNILVRAQNELRARGLSLHVRDASAAALRVLAICGVTSLLETAVPALATWVAVPASAKQTVPADPTPEPAMAVVDRGTA